MNKNYALILIALLLAPSSLATAMEAPPLAHKEIPAQSNSVKNLSELCCKRILALNLRDVEQSACPDVIEQLKKTVLNSHPLFFTDLCKTVQHLDVDANIDSLVLSTNNAIAAGTSRDNIHLFNIRENALTDVQLVGKTEQLEVLRDLFNNPWINGPQGVILDTKPRHTSLDVSMDGTCILTGSTDKTATLWHFSKNVLVPLKVLIGHTASITTVALSPDNSFALTGSCDQTVRLWDLQKEPAPFMILAQGSAKSILFSPNGKYAVVTHRDSTRQLWNFHSKSLTLVNISVEEEPLLPNQFSPVTEASFSPDSKYLAWRSLRGRHLHIWNLEKDIPELTTLHSRIYIICFAFSPDSKKMITSEVIDHNNGTPSALLLWDLNNTPPVSKPLRGHSSYIQKVGFSNDGNSLLTADRTGEIRLWDLHQDPMPSIVVSEKSTGNKLIAFSKDGSTIVYFTFKNPDPAPFNGNMLLNPASFLKGIDTGEQKITVINSAQLLEKISRLSVTYLVLLAAASKSTSVATLLKKTCTDAKQSEYWRHDPEIYEYLLQKLKQKTPLFEKVSAIPPDVRELILSYDFSKYCFHNGEANNKGTGSQRPKRGRDE